MEIYPPTWGGCFFLIKKKSSFGLETSVFKEEIKKEIINKIALLITGSVPILS
jgi:hypothetical protein